MEILRSQACRDAPTLLGYVPSYKGKLKRKEKEEGELSKKAATSKKGGKQKGGNQQKRGSKKGKELRVKFPTFRKITEFWFRESVGIELLGINIPLRTIVPEFSEEMSRRNVVRVNLRDNVSAWANESDVAEPREKRPKTHDFFPAKLPTPHSSEKERTDTSAVGGSKAV